MSELKEKFITSIRSKLYKLSEDRYNNYYSTQNVNTFSQVEVIKTLDELYTECFSTSYLKEIEEYVGYCGWTINTELFTYDWD